MQSLEKIWMNGELIDWADAKVHVGTHGLHYGSGVFEGIRAYETAKGSAVFRLSDHLRRLANSAKLLYMDLPYSLDELKSACIELIGANGRAECYLRPVAFYGYGELGRRDADHVPRRAGVQPHRPFVQERTLDRDRGTAEREHRRLDRPRVHATEFAAVDHCVQRDDRNDEPAVTVVCAHAGTGARKLALADRQLLEARLDSGVPEHGGDCFDWGWPHGADAMRVRSQSSAMNRASSKSDAS